MKLDDFDQLEYSDFCLHNVLANTSFGLLQVFYVELESLRRHLNRIVYLILEGSLF